MYNQYHQLKTHEDESKCKMRPCLNRRVSSEMVSWAIIFTWWKGEIPHYDDEPNKCFSLSL